MQLQNAPQQNNNNRDIIPWTITSNGSYTIGDFDSESGQEIEMDVEEEEEEEDDSNNNENLAKMKIIKTDDVIRLNKNDEDEILGKRKRGLINDFKPPNVGTFVVDVKPTTLTKTINYSGYYIPPSTPITPENNDEYFDEIEFVNNNEIVCSSLIEQQTDDTNQNIDTNTNITTLTTTNYTITVNDPGKMQYLWEIFDQNYTNIDPDHVISVCYPYYLEIVKNTQQNQQQERFILNKFRYTNRILTLNKDYINDSRYNCFKWVIEGLNEIGSTYQEIYSITFDNNSNPESNYFDRATGFITIEIPYENLNVLGYYGYRIYNTETVNNFDYDAANGFCKLELFDCSPINSNLNQTLTVTQNGVYHPNNDYSRFKEITVNVENKIQINASTINLIKNNSNLKKTYIRNGNLNTSGGTFLLLIIYKDNSDKVYCTWRSQNGGGDSHLNITNIKFGIYYRDWTSGFDDCELFIKWGSENLLKAWNSQYGEDSTVSMGINYLPGVDLIDDIV